MLGGLSTMHSSSLVTHPHGLCCKKGKDAKYGQNMFFFSTNSHVKEAYENYVTTSHLFNDCTVYCVGALDGNGLNKFSSLIN